MTTPELTAMASSLDRKPLHSDVNGIWILVAAILGSSMVFIDGTVVNVALPALQAAFHTSGTTLQWIIESYALSLASLLLVGGSFGDLYGRKRMFLLGVTIFAGASMTCGFATTTLILCISRAVQGVGGALLVPGSLALISASFPEETRGRAIGIWSGSTAVTASFGPLAGGWLIENATWRLIFFLNVPVAIMVIVVCCWKVPESRNSSATKPDWPGAVLASMGLGLCTFALIEGADHPLNYLGVFALGVTLLIGFVFWERRSSHPMMPPEVFRSRNFAVANFITLLIYAALSGALYYLPLQLIQIQHYTAARAGAVLLPMTILIAVLSRWTGGLIQRMGPRVPLALGAILSAAGYALLLLLEPKGSYMGTVLPGVFMLGLGLAVIVAPLTTTVMNAVAQERSGTASGINNAISNVASVLAIAVCGLIFSATFSKHLQSELMNSTLQSAAKEQIFAHRKELGGMVVRGGESQDIINRAFEGSLHLVLSLAGALSLIAAVATLFLGKKLPDPRTR